MLHLEIYPNKQQLVVFEGTQILKEYPIATAKNGLGELAGSEKTPRGWHSIRAKIGADQPLYTVFKRRRPTGEIYTPELSQQYPDRDWILTRILWLSGLEQGKNRLGAVDTMRRYIYIHGCPDEIELGTTPSSHGCIRMHSSALVELFEWVEKGTRVWIADQE